MAKSIRKPQITAVVVLAAVAVFLAMSIFWDGRRKSSLAPSEVLSVSAESLPTTRFDILESPHLRAFDGVAYNSNPPTSGPHLDTQVDWGVYDRPVRDEQAVHNLEHGGIWISYRPDLDADSVAVLGRIAATYPGAVILSPRPANDSPVVVASWGRKMDMTRADEALIDAYIGYYVNNSPEKLARVDQNRPDLKPGTAFPAFSLQDVDGVRISNASLSGKPVILWFTAGWCVPCQIGARKVARLDTSLGGDAFNVVVVFVDPREERSDLLSWKKKFANPDWTVAFDNNDAPLADLVRLQFLDSKYLIDSDGVLQNIDFRIADDSYLARIERNVARN